MKRLIVFLAVVLLVAPFSLLGQDEPELTDIHRRLQTPGIEARHDHRRMLFVGEIVALGPVFQGVCKQAVDQSVDYRVLEGLLGNPPNPIVRTGYVNCTRASLPSPPFTPHSKVIVYCFYNTGGPKCLDPVRWSEQRIIIVKSWIVDLNKRTGSD